jgi:hypothetical protein
MRGFAYLGCLLAFATPDAHALGWGVNGHAPLTFDVAEAASVPADVARAMAFGSMAPDYFEFDNEPAHAQQREPKVTFEGGRYRAEPEAPGQREKDLDAAAGWHEVYMAAAVHAMRRGNREQAAFLLGYAMHNSEDAAAHRMMSNLEHAYRNTFPDEAVRPDSDRRARALAHRLARDDMEEFKARVGPAAWDRFRSAEPIGDELRLGRWNPREGYPPSEQVGDKAAMLTAEFAESVTNAIATLWYGVDTSGMAGFRDDWVWKMDHAFGGLFLRHHIMAEMLRDGLRAVGSKRTVADRSLSFVRGLTRFAATFSDECVRFDVLWSDSPCLVTRYARLDPQDQERLARHSRVEDILKARLTLARDLQAHTQDGLRYIELLIAEQDKEFKAQVDAYFASQEGARSIPSSGAFNEVWRPPPPPAPEASPRRRQSDPDDDRSSGPYGERSGRLPRSFGPGGFTW